MLGRHRIDALITDLDMPGAHWLQFNEIGYQQRGRGRGDRDLGWPCCSRGHGRAGLLLGEAVSEGSHSHGIGEPDVVSFRPLVVMHCTSESENAFFPLDT